MEKQLPKNWVETELGNVLCRITNGANLEQSDINTTNSYPISRIETIANETIDFNRVKYCLPSMDQIEKYLLTKGDILFSHINSDKHLGKTAIYLSSKPLIHGVNLLLLRSNNDLFNNRTLNYLIKYMRLTGSFMDIAQRAVNQSSINQKKLSNLIIPLPPLAEQERIAEKLDALFGQLDSVRGAMSRIPTLLANLRQQILTHAVTGKLTQEWRQGKNLEGWKPERADECCIKVQSGGTPKGGNFSTVGIPFLKVYNIVQNKIDFEYQPQYVTNEIQNTQIKKSITYPGDVIMNIVGPPLNKIAIIPSTYPEWNLNQAITLFRTKDYLMKEYLYYFFCEGSSVNSLINETRGVVGQVNISLSQCRAFIIDIPPKSEQEEIVNRVQSLSEKLDSIELRYQMLKTKLENLPQAILHKAFKGELVEQLPTDGNATDLLHEIEQLKKSLKKK